MSVAQHPWYFETDTARDAMEGRRLLERYLADHCSDSDLFAASLVFGELISNVIKHSPSGGVRIWLEHDADRYALCIEDDGRGFDSMPASLPDSDAESGRGLFLVQHFSQGLQYHRNGGFKVRAVLPVKKRA